MEYKLMTENLSVGYGRTVIIENAVFSVEKGEIISIIGSNGSGKSTILKSISAQLPALCGKIITDGTDVKKLSPNEIAKKMSVMTTERLKTELMTCREAVESGRYPYTNRLGILTEKDIAEAENAMKITNTLGISQKDFNEISDGQRQRVMLARSICQGAEILLLDEPTSFLDIKYKLELLEILKDLAKNRNRTVIMSIHELELAKIISDRIICIKNRKIDRIGSPDEIFSGDYIEKLFDIKSSLFRLISL